VRKLEQQAQPESGDFSQQKCPWGVNFNKVNFY